jgi:hypothetical protein
MQISKLLHVVKKEGDFDMTSFVVWKIRKNKLPSKGR